MKEERLKKFIEILGQKPLMKWAKDLKKEFPEAKIYLVGGIVRDKLLGRKSEDLDFVIGQVPAKKLHKFLTKRGKVKLVGTTFGVRRFIPSGVKLKKGKALDIALPRTEISTGPGYREFKISYDHKLPIKEDLSRRDLTVNAMAQDLETGELIDPFDGKKDLEKKLIRTVREPKDRFSEDYSRILRALRFSCQLDFEIEEKTWQAICKYAPKILEKRLFSKEKEEKIREWQRETVPWETVGKEFLKTLDAYPEKCLDLYDKSGILKIVLPEVEDLKEVKQPPEFHEEGDVYVHTCLTLKNLKKDASKRLKLATLLHDIGKPPTQKTPERDGTDRIRFDEHDQVGAKMTEKICRRLRLPRQITDDVVWLIAKHMLFVSANVEEMRKGTIKKYFIDDLKRGDDLLDLYQTECLSSFGPHHHEGLKKYENTVKYIEEVRGSFKEAKVETFKDIINGNVVMTEFGIKPGPKVGELLGKANDFITDYISQHKKKPTKEEVLEYLK